MSNDNRRVRMTKKMIKEAFIDLLNESDIRSINISELCDAADVNRTTFYKYYADQYELLDEITAEIMESISTNLDKPTLTDVLALLSKNLNLVYLILSNSFDKDLPETFFAIPAIANSVELPVTEKSGYTAVYEREFYIFGSYRIIYQWLRSGCREPAAKIAELIQTKCKSI